jgi:crossover junction endodeoxyribonuclease RuvC
MGYAVVREDGSELTLAVAGVLETGADAGLPSRLSYLYAGLLQIIDDYHPTELAVEELFFNQNVRTALSVGQARGVALLAAAHRQLSVASYTPLAVKLAMTGYGRARKDQIQEMVRVLLRLDSPPQPDDAADAAAIAICHLNGAGLRERLAAVTDDPPGGRAPRSGSRRPSSRRQ